MAGRKRQVKQWMTIGGAVAALGAVLGAAAVLLHVVTASSARWGVASGALQGMPEVVVAVLGIAITVVAIIVELAANRYTARVTELFMTAPINLAFLLFFVVTALVCTVTAIVDPDAVDPAVWMALSGATVVSVLLSLVLLLPYFSFVFSFLDPHHIVETIAASIVRAVGTAARRTDRVPATQRRVVRAIEQLADMASGAMESKDKGVCMHAVNALGDMVVAYQKHKTRVPDAWFALSEHVRDNPDFVSMQPEVRADIEAKRYWVEMKVLRQFQMVYGEALNRMRDINYLVAINTKKIGLHCADSDREVTRLCVKFFNTYLRATINARDVRTAYNVFNQYRLFAESALAMGHVDLVTDIGSRFRYYGQLGFSAGLPFVLETAAYDLCEIAEQAYRRQAPCVDALLDIVLEVDKEAEEGHSMEASLRGVRKAQMKLAAFFLLHGDEARARRVFDDMRDEIPSRIASIRDEFASVTSKEFWEINDRGVHFDYLDPERRAALNRFFSWFAQ